MWNEKEKKIPHESKSTTMFTSLVAMATINNGTLYSHDIAASHTLWFKNKNKKKNILPALYKFLNRKLQTQANKRNMERCYVQEQEVGMYRTWWNRVCVCFPYNIYLCWETDWPPVAPQSYFLLLKLQTELAGSARPISPPRSPSEPCGWCPLDQGCWLGRWTSGSEGSHYLERVRIKKKKRFLNPEFK